MKGHLASDDRCQGALFLLLVDHIEGFVRRAGLGDLFVVEVCDDDLGLSYSLRACLAKVAAFCFSSYNSFTCQFRSCVSKSLARIMQKPHSVKISKGSGFVFPVEDFALDILVKLRLVATDFIEIISQW
jgi:hypothetical protein